jgi:hypothetical protein
VPPDLSQSPHLLAGVLLGLVGSIVFVAGFVALWKARPLRFAVRTFFGLLFLAIGALLCAIAVGTHGFKALTHEDVAARITIKPLAPQRFSATVRFADGREAAYELAGDQVYVDAHIVKWKPVANLLGLHTAYELDRIAGRYRSIDDERNAPRTVYSLRRDRPIDLVSLRQRHALLGSFFDTEYGSATYVPATGGQVLEVRVSTTGLLMREAK